MATELYKSSLFTRSLAKTNSDYSALDNCGSKKTSNSASIFINNSSSCDDTSSSGTTWLEKLAAASQVVGLATSCVALGNAGVKLGSSLSPDDKKDTKTDDGSKTTEKTTESLSTAVDKAEDSGDWTQVQSQVQTAMEQKDGLESQQTTIGTQIGEQDTIITACNGAGDTQYCNTVKITKRACDVKLSDAAKTLGSAKGDAKAKIVGLNADKAAATTDADKAKIQEQIDAQEELIKEAEAQYKQTKEEAEKVKETKISDAKKQMDTRKDAAQKQKETLTEKARGLDSQIEELQNTINTAQAKLAKRDMQVDTTNSTKQKNIQAGESNAISSVG